MSVSVYYFIECKEPGSKQWKCIFNHNRTASLALRDAIRGYTPGEMQSNDFTIDNNPDLSPVVLQAMCRAQNERNQFYSSKEERHPVIWSWVYIWDIFNYLDKKIDDWFEKLDERTVNSQNSFVTPTQRSRNVGVKALMMNTIKVLQIIRKP